MLTCRSRPSGLQLRHRVGVVERALPERLVVPDVLADRDADARGRRRCSTSGPVAGLEVAALVEDVVGRQQALAVDGRRARPRAGRDRGVEDAAAAARRGWRRASRRSSVASPAARAIRSAAFSVAATNGAPLDQVARRVAADGELGKEDEVGALGFRAAAGREDLLGVARRSPRPSCRSGRRRPAGAPGDLVKRQRVARTAGRPASGACGSRAVQSSGRPAAAAVASVPSPAAQRRAGAERPPAPASRARRKVGQRHAHRPSEEDERPGRSRRARGRAGTRGPRRSRRPRACAGDQRARRGCASAAEQQDRGGVGGRRGPARRDGAAAGAAAPAGRSPARRPRAARSDRPPRPLRGAESRRGGRLPFAMHCSASSYGRCWTWRT